MISAEREVAREVLRVTRERLVDQIELMRDDWNGCRDDGLIGDAAKKPELRGQALQHQIADNCRIDVLPGDVDPFLHIGTGFDLAGL